MIEQAPQEKPEHKPKNPLRKFLSGAALVAAGLGMGDADRAPLIEAQKQHEQEEADARYEALLDAKGADDILKNEELAAAEDQFNKEFPGVMAEHIKKWGREYAKNFKPEKLEVIFRTIRAAYARKNMDRFSAYLDGLRGEKVWKAIEKELIAGLDIMSKERSIGTQLLFEEAIKRLDADDINKLISGMCLAELSRPVRDERAEESYNYPSDPGMGNHVGIINNRIAMWEAAWEHRPLDAEHDYKISLNHMEPFLAAIETAQNPDVKKRLINLIYCTANNSIKSMIFSATPYPDDSQETMRPRIQPLEVELEHRYHLNILERFERDAHGFTGQRFGKANLKEAVERLRAKGFTVKGDI